MRSTLTGIAATVGIGALALGSTVFTVPAEAATTTPVSFACFNGAASGCPTSASFHGYATGSEVHLDALTAGNTTVANLDQGFSGASTASQGLTSLIRSETTSLVQPAQSAAVKAYGTGSGLEIGLGTDTLSSTDQNQIQVAGRAEQVAPPNGAAVTKSIPVSASPIVQASVLDGEGAAVYDNQVCPLGQPISYGTGNAAGVGVLYASGTPTISTAGTGTSVAQSSALTYLSYNSDSPASSPTFGLSTAASDIIAPISANLPGGFAVQVAVQSAGGVDEPVSLTATTTGEATGASVKFSTDDLLKVSLITPASTTPTNLITVPLTAIGPAGLHIPLSTSSLGSTLTTLQGAVSGLASTIPGVGSTLSGVLSSSTATTLLNTVGTTASDVANQVATVNLGYIDVDTAPHAIGGTATSPATIVGGTSASGALDLLHVNLALSGTAGGQPLPTVNVADFRAGHLEVSSNLTNPILCSLPVIKTANPTSVSAGQSFEYDIQVPDPAKLDLIDCNLDNVSETDTISDYSGNPSFNATSAKDTQTGAAGQIQTVSAHKAIVSWSGLSYKVAATGQPPNAPIPTAITVSIPSTSSAGVITDTVLARGTVLGCQGGASAIANLGLPSTGVDLTGSYTLNQPSVTGALAAGAAKRTLPFTGAMGGLWQPIGGLAALAAGGAALGLVRRARRISGK
jgi:hypothetical protein